LTKDAPSTRPTRGGAEGTKRDRLGRQPGARLSDDTRALNLFCGFAFVGVLPRCTSSRASQFDPSRLPNHSSGSFRDVSDQTSASPGRPNEVDAQQTVFIIYYIVYLPLQGGLPIRLHADFNGFLRSDVFSFPGRSRLRAIRVAACVAAPRIGGLRNRRQPWPTASGPPAAPPGSRATSNRFTARASRACASQRAR
jgi:hypothetical protein